MTDKYIPLEEKLLERSGELFHPKRGEVVDFKQRKPFEDDELEEEFYNLISTAYSAIGGHLKIKKPSDVFKDKKINYWEGVDIHGTDDFDILIFGRKTKYGVKFSGIGHDGTKDSKRKYLELRSNSLRKSGFYVEVSGKLADILMSKFQVPIVSDEGDVRKALDKDIEWIGDKEPGWYFRSIGGKKVKKIMLGKPRV